MGRMATLTRSQKLARAHARDRTFDGRFITGVLSTGIYCLPSCGARRPKPENVRFFDDETGAQGAGLRPCKRCRPDLFYRNCDPDVEIAEAIAERIRTDPASFPDAGSVATAAGFGVTATNDLFRRHFHDSVGGFLAAARVRHAARALLETRRRVVSIALDAGFESQSAFHDRFRRLTGMTPAAYRKLGAAQRFAIALPDGYRADEALASLGRDLESVSERAVGKTFWKALLLENSPARLAIDLGRAGSARCRVESARPVGAEGMAAAHAAAQRMLGLASDPSAFERRMARTPKLRRLLGDRRGLRIPLTTSVFEGITWTIVGQQVNLAFAATCRRRLIELAGRNAGDGMVAHPSPAEVARVDYADLTKLQYSRRKAEYIVDTARLIASGELPAESLPDASALRIERTLLAVRGIGVWSAQYVLMRSCGLADCVPVGDAGLVVALQRFFDLDERPGPDETRALMEPFAPHRSLATFHLWKTLGDPT